MSQRKCLPNLVLIDAMVCQILLKRKCDGRTEGIPIVPLFAPQMVGDKNTCSIYPFDHCKNLPKWSTQKSTQVTDPKIYPAEVILLRCPAQKSTQVVSLFGIYLDGSRRLIQSLRR